MSPATVHDAASMSMSQTPESPSDPFQVLAATLCELFQLPCDEVLRQVNAQFAANPLTADFRLHLGPAQPR